jgi:hypothetical protein
LAKLTVSCKTYGKNLGPQRVPVKVIIKLPDKTKNPPGWEGFVGIFKAYLFFFI